jgi:hypothetical protein
MTLEELKPGDKITGFTGFNCLRKDSIRAIATDRYGCKFIVCQMGKHYLSGNIETDGTLGDIRFAESKARYKRICSKV